MAKRKIVEPVLESWCDADVALVRLCQADNKLTGLILRMDLEISAIREKYAGKVRAAGEESDALRADLRIFAESRRAEFEPKKSVERLHGILSFRTSPPAVKLLNRKWTWDAVLAALAADRPQLIREKPEIAKDIILCEFAAGNFAPEHLAQFGLAVRQDETFGIELRYESAPETPEAKAAN